MRLNQNQDIWGGFHEIYPSNGCNDKPAGAFRRDRNNCGQRGRTGNCSIFQHVVHRACLTDLLTQYVDGLARGDHSELPLAATFRFTENSQAMQLDDGL